MGARWGPGGGPLGSVRGPLGGPLGGSRISHAHSSPSEARGVIGGGKRTNSTLNAGK